MAEKNGNIRQRPEERYPEPAIPATDGWKSMESLLDTAIPVEGKPRFRLLFFLLTTAFIGAVGLIFYLFSKNPANHQSPQRQDNPVTTQHPALKEKANQVTTTSPPESAYIQENEPENSSTRPPNAASQLNSSFPESSQPTGQTSAANQYPVRSFPSDTRESKLAENKIKNTTKEIIKVIPADIDMPEISPDADTAANAPLWLQPLNRKNAYRLPQLHDLQLPLPGFPERPREPETSHVNMKKVRLFNWGIQWAGNFPLAGRKTYARDLKEKYGAYILAIPGIWVGREIGSRQEVALSLRPYFDYYSKNDLFFQNFTPENKPQNPSDTLLDPPLQNRTKAYLLKLRSSSVTAEYHYRLAGNLRVGGELSYQHHWNALGNIRQFDGSGFSDAADSLKWLNRTDGLWKSGRLNNLTAGLNLSYRTRRVSLGGSVTMPLLPTAKPPYDSSKPFNSRVFIRWQLNSPKKNR